MKDPFKLNPSASDFIQVESQGAIGAGKRALEDDLMPRKTAKKK